MNELIAKRYAKALMEVSSSKEIKKQLADLESLKTVLASKEAREIIDSPLVSANEKFSLVIEPLKSSIDEKLYRLLEVMSEKGRLNLIPALAEILNLEVKKSSNQFEGSVSSDEELSDAEIKRLETILAKYSGAKISLKQSSEKIDGLRVEVDDLGLELSLSKTRIKADLLDFIQRGL